MNRHPLQAALIEPRTHQQVQITSPVQYRSEEDSETPWNETREALAAHYWSSELTTPLCAAEISEALGEMDENQHLELAEAHAEKDDAVLGRYIKRIVHAYWENWCLAQADRTLQTLRIR